MLTQEEVEMFKKLVLEIYGIELTDGDANDQGSRLIMLFELVLKIKHEQAQNVMSTVNNER